MPGAWQASLLRLMVLLIAVLAPLRGIAHPMPESRIWIDADPAGLRLTLQIPLNRLEFAFGQPLADAPDTVLARHGDALARYLLLHVGARSGQQGWQAMRPVLRVEGHDRSAELQATMSLRAPPGVDARHLALLVDAVTHEVRTHRVQVYLRTDWEAGFAAQAPLLLGEMGSERTALPVDLSQARAGSSFMRLFKDGARHIAEGTDHLLFLLMLLIVAPLSVVAGRWAAPRSGDGPLRQTAAIVTAFTAGHSVTLALGSTGVLALPSQPVEIAVALSIAVVAVHALRPLFRHGEVVLALLFGLIHGMAFSASLSGAGLTAWQHAQALLAFNLGIEAMQLLLLMLAVPLLVALARRMPAGYARLRLGAAALSVAAAATWVVQRVDVDGALAQAPMAAAASFGY